MLSDPQYIPYSAVIKFKPVLTQLCYQTKQQNTVEDVLINSAAKKFISEVNITLE